MKTHWTQAHREVIHSWYFGFLFASTWLLAKVVSFHYRILLFNLFKIFNIYAFTIIYFCFSQQLSINCVSWHTNLYPSSPSSTPFRSSCSILNVSTFTSLHSTFSPWNPPESRPCTAFLTSRAHWRKYTHYLHYSYFLCSGDESWASRVPLCSYFFSCLSGPIHICYTLGRLNDNFTENDSAYFRSFLDEIFRYPS